RLPWATCSCLKSSLPASSTPQFSTAFRWHKRCYTQAGRRSGTDATAAQGDTDMGSLGFVDKISKSLPFDGSDMSGGISYQMVPVGGQRDVVFQTERNPCVLKVEDSSKLTMRDFRFFDTGAPLPVSPEAHFIRLSVPNTTIRFSLVAGNTPGFTGVEFV